jgi:acyl-CoA hydrolase
VPVPEPQPPADCLPPAAAGEARVIEFVFPSDTNPLGTLFGGTLVAWMDKAAAVAAIRRSRGSVVTAAIEALSFAVPIRQGDMVELVGEVEHVGRTSMRVRVQVWREPHGGGPAQMATEGRFTMVAIGEDGRPRAVDPA